MVKLLIMYSNQPPTQEHVYRLKALREDVSVVVASSEATAIQYAADVDVILGHRYLRQTLPHTRHLKWVQSNGGWSPSSLNSRFHQGCPYPHSLPHLFRHSCLACFYACLINCTAYSRSLYSPATRSMGSLPLRYVVLPPNCYDSGRRLHWPCAG